MIALKFRLASLFNLVTACAACIAWWQWSPCWFPGWQAIAGVTLCAAAMIFCREGSAAIGWFVVGLMWLECDAVAGLLATLMVTSCTHPPCDFHWEEALAGGVSLPVLVLVGSAGFWLERLSPLALLTVLERNCGRALLSGTVSIAILMVSMGALNCCLNERFAAVRRERALDLQRERLLRVHQETTRPGKHRVDCCN